MTWVVEACALAATHNIPVEWMMSTNPAEVAFATAVLERAVELRRSLDVRAAVIGLRGALGG